MRPFASLSTVGQARRHRLTAVAACSRYGLHLANLRQLTIHTNFVYGVSTTDGRRFVLRVQRPGLHGHQDTELELWWTTRLHAAGLPVAAPVANVDGELVTVVPATPAVPEAHSCVLFHWLPGRDADEDQPGFWAQLGALAATLHDHAAGLRVPQRFTPRTWDRVLPYEAGRIFDPDHSSLIDPTTAATLRAGPERLDSELAQLAAGVAAPAYNTYIPLLTERVARYLAR